MLPLSWSLYLARLSTNELISKTLFLLQTFCAKDALERSCYLKIDFKIPENVPVYDAVKRMAAHHVRQSSSSSIYSTLTSTYLNPNHLTIPLPTLVLGWCFSSNCCWWQRQDHRHHQWKRLSIQGLSLTHTYPINTPLTHLTQFINLPLSPSLDYYLSLASCQPTSDTSLNYYLLIYFLSIYWRLHSWASRVEPPWSARSSPKVSERASERANNPNYTL